MNGQADGSIGGTSTHSNTDTWRNEDFLSLNVPNEEDDEKNESDDQSYDSMRSIDENKNEGSIRQLCVPWIKNGKREHDSRRVHPLVALHNEIVSFCHLMEPLPSEIEQREKLIARVKQTVANHFDQNTKVEVFGSQATGLFLPTSDIDIVVTTMTSDGEEQSSEGQEENPSDLFVKNEQRSPLQRFAAAIQDEWLDELSYFEVIEKTRVPLVKFKHAPTKIHVDVCFNQPTGPPAALLMSRYLHCLPPLRPLTIVLKYFLAARGLNEPYSGGVGSYMLQLLIVAFLQHRERDAINFKRPAVHNLGALLLEFFELFGVNFNYLVTGISVRNNGFFFPKGASDRKDVFWQQQRPLLVALENPLEVTHDVGSSSFRFQIVQRAFAAAYKILLCYTVEPVLEHVPSILATILPPTDYMSSRLILKRRDQALIASRQLDNKTVRSRKRQRR
jgi:non-canonical poly(A) RNA polymerase PAPD5/7